MIGSRVSHSNEPNFYARKHAPWISFTNVPNGLTIADSSNLRFLDFPSDYSSLPTISIVIPNLVNDMYNGSIPYNIMAGDRWLRERINGYYNWAKEHNSLLILTFDENDKKGEIGLTNPADVEPEEKNQIVTILAGAHIKPGDYTENKGVTHVNILRTLEARYKLNKSGAQQQNSTPDWGEQCRHPVTGMDKSCVADVACWYLDPGPFQPILTVASSAEPACD